MGKKKQEMHDPDNPKGCGAEGCDGGYIAVSTDEDGFTSYRPCEACNAEAKSSAERLAEFEPQPPISAAGEHVEAPKTVEDQAQPPRPTGEKITRMRPAQETARKIFVRQAREMEAAFGKALAPWFDQLAKIDEKIVALQDGSFLRKALDRLAEKREKLEAKIYEMRGPAKVFGEQLELFAREELEEPEEAARLAQELNGDTSEPLPEGWDNEEDAA